MKPIKVGIVGCGFVGGALKTWLDENNSSVQVFVSDAHDIAEDVLEIVEGA